jgi:hypothetical protein
MSKCPTFIPLDLRLPSQDDTYQHSPLAYCPLPPSDVSELLKYLHVGNFFDAEVILARHYAAQLHDQGLGQRKIELADELTERMEQINFLCKSVAVLVQRNFAGLSAKPPRRGIPLLRAPGTVYPEEGKGRTSWRAWVRALQAGDANPKPLDRARLLED